MSYRFHPRVPAQNCSGGPQPGLVALAQALEELFPEQANWGIYNCRTVRGKTSLSHHAEGRAYDCGIPMVNGKPNTKLGDPICLLLLENAYELGLDHVIWNGEQWSAKYPDGAPYSGDTPTLRHEDHIHIGMTWEAARSMTKDKILEILKGDDMAITRYTRVDDGLDVLKADFDKKRKQGVFTDQTHPGEIVVHDRLAAYLNREQTKVTAKAIASAVSSAVATIALDKAGIVDAVLNEIVRRLN